jgi:hypothetical protein
VTRSRWSTSRFGRRPQIAVTDVGARRAGVGLVVSGTGRFEGVIARAEGIEDVLALLDRDLSDVVLLTEQASATAFSPILPLLRGVLCTKGGPSAHLAIVSRALQIPCLMQVQLDESPADGVAVCVDADGRIDIT